MTPNALKKKIASDPRTAFEIVAINNHGALVNALMADNILFGNSTEAECVDALMSLHDMGESSKINNIMSQVEYLSNSDLPEGYDAVLLEGFRVQRNAVNTGGDGGSTGIDWSSIINNVITTVGSNINDWTGQTGNDQPAPAPAPGPAPASTTDYTPFLIGGGALTLLVILILVMRK